MGNASVALSAVEKPLIKARFLPENVFWVSCIEATSATLLLEVLRTQLQVSGNIGQEKIISVLATSTTQPRLILLDKFEIPYNALDGTQKQVEDTLRRLAMLSHVPILVTVPGRYPPCDEAIKWQLKKIQPTDEAVYPDSENDPDVGRLLRILGHMPFAITLRARLAKEGLSTVKDLIEWSKYGPDILPKHHMNRSICLSVNRNLMNRTLKPASSIFSLSYQQEQRMQPSAGGIPALDPSLVPSESAIATLFKTGLLFENRRQDSDSPILFVLPVVQSFMQQHGRIGKEIWQNIQSPCSQYILDHVRRENNPALSKLNALAAEDVNILCSSPTTQDSDMLSCNAIDTLIAFSWYRCEDAKLHLEIAKHSVSMAKTFGNKTCIASSLWYLGTTYGFLGEVYAAHDYL